MKFLEISLRIDRLYHQYSIIGMSVSPLAHLEYIVIVFASFERLRRGETHMPFSPIRELLDRAVLKPPLWDIHVCKWSHVSHFKQLPCINRQVLT